MDAPKTKYVEVGDAPVAYQVGGEGPLDLLYFYGHGSHVAPVGSRQPHVKPSTRSHRSRVHKTAG